MLPENSEYSKYINIAFTAQILSKIYFNQEIQYSRNS